MKGFKKWLFALTAAVLAAFAAFGLAACDEDNEGGGSDAITHPESYVGLYRIEQAKFEGFVTTTYNIGDNNIFGTNNLKLTEDYMDLELKADGTATITTKHPTSLYCFTGTKTGTWGVRGGEWLELPFLRENMPEGVLGCTVDYADGKITFSYTMPNMNHCKFILKKQAA